MSLIADAVAEQHMAPWVRDPRNDDAWVLHLGGEHIITMALVTNGAGTERSWMWRWERGPTLTIHEASGFEGPNECMRAMWLRVFELFDRYHELVVADARRILKGGLGGL